MSILLEKVAEFPEMKAKQLAKKLKTTIQGIYSARTVIKRRQRQREQEQEQEDRPRKMANSKVDLLEDIKIIKKIGIERVKTICELLE